MEPGFVPRGIRFPKGLCWPMVLFHIFNRQQRIGAYRVCSLSDGMSLEGVTIGGRAVQGRRNNPWQRQDVPGSAFIFPAQVLRSAISFKSCGSFKQRMVFRDKHLIAQCASCYGGFFAFRPSQQTELGNGGKYSCKHRHSCMQE